MSEQYGVGDASYRAAGGLEGLRRLVMGPVWSSAGPSTRGLRDLPERAEAVCLSSGRGHHPNG